MSNLIDSGVLPRQVIRARNVLSAAGAWDASPDEIFCSGANYIILCCDYERGGAAGAVDIQLQASPNSVDIVGEPDWYPMCAYSTGAVASGADTQSLVQAEYTTFQPLTANQETFVIGPMELQSCIERLRLVARESGNVGAPGDLCVWASLG